MDKNQKLSKGTFSPLESFYWIENSFFQHLSTLENWGREKIESLTENYKQKFLRNEKKVTHLITNELDRGNVYFTLIAVSAYETFLEIGICQDEAILLTDECLNKPSRQYIVDGTKQILDHSDNPFKSLVEVSKEREKAYFGDSFTFERLIDNEFGYVLQVKKCLYHLTLKELNRTELQHSLCRMDLGWINCIDNEKHNLQFVRPVTFASGNTCEMWFMKKEKEMIKD